MNRGRRETRGGVLHLFNTNDVFHTPPEVQPLIQVVVGGQRQLEIYDQKLTANRGSGEGRKLVTNPGEGNGKPPPKDYQENDMTAY